MQSLFRHAKLLLLCIGLTCYQAVAQDLQSKIADKISKQPLAYASIGILNTKIGTIADENGKFSIPKDIIRQHLGDTLKLGAIGFKAKYFLIKEDNFLPAEILLEEEIISLKEVTVSSNSYTIEKTLGTKSESSNTITGWGFFGTGGERGLKISLGEKKALLKSVNFYIRQNRFEEVLFRVHIRSLKKDIPQAEIIDKNILTTTSVTRGWIQVDLSEYRIIQNGDIMVSLEVLKAKGKCAEAPCLVFSGQLLKGTLYAKEASEDNWKIKKRFSPSIFLTVLYP